MTYLILAMCIVVIVCAFAVFYEMEPPNWKEWLYIMSETLAASIFMSVLLLITLLIYVAFRIN